VLIDRQDVLHALRAARRTPLLTCVAVLALSVGIGLNAGVFTVLNFLFFEPPTRQQPSIYAQVYPHYDGWFPGASQFPSLNTDDFDAIRAQAHTLSDVAAWQEIRTTLDNQLQKSNSLLVTCNYFRVLGIGHALTGRFFLPGECAPGSADRVAVLSEHTWRNLFASDPHIVGKAIHIDGEPLTVVGVASDSDANQLAGGIWIPYTLQPLFNHGNSAFQSPWPWLTVATRLQPGYNRAEAAAELQTILRRRDSLYTQQRSFPLDRKTSVGVTDGSFLRNPRMQPLVAGMTLLILGPLSLVLLLACTNVTMLFLSRAIARRGELAVRLALGAGRARLMRMLALESFFTALAAGMASIFLAARIPALILGSLDPLQSTFIPNIRPNWTVFVYLAALVLIATITSALAPLRESFRFDLATALKGREGTATTRTRATSVLIVAQIAMSFVLLAAAVLFARLPSAVTGIDPGFAARNLMTVPLDINIPPYTPSSAVTFYRTLNARILAIPGVQSLTYASIAPFGSAPQNEVRLENQLKGHGRTAAIDDVSANYFSTFGIPLLRGRPFPGPDVSASGSPPVAVVSRSFARAFWGDADPIGKAIVTPDDHLLTVIGVAQDTRSERYGMLDGPRLYTLRRSDALEGQLFVRFRGDAAPISASIRQIVKALDPGQLDIPYTIWAFLEDDAFEIRALARIILFMAGVAVLLAVTGLYAVLNFVIRQRTREFGIQMMLGATQCTIFRSVITRGARQVVVGLFGGLLLAVPAAWMFARMTTKSTLPIRAFDISVYGISALILIVVSLCAMSIPALKATQVDPMQALRTE
jgi:predicted permease